MNGSEYRAADGETLAGICAAFYGYQSGVVELVIEQNPALIEHTHLTAGDVVYLPRVDSKENEPIAGAVNLWD